MDSHPPENDHPQPGVAPPSANETPSADALPYATPPDARPMEPTREPERIVAMDALRGFALFGILIVNIKFFAEGMPLEEEPFWSSGSLVDDIANFIVRFFGNYKFVTLFSLLFGMGLAIQSERAARRNHRFIGFYLRRLLILLGFGIVHGVVFWYGDILTMYAILGAVAILFRRASRAALLSTATILLLIPLITLPGLFAMQEFGRVAQAAQQNGESSVTADDGATTDNADLINSAGERKPIDFERIMSEGSAIEVELYGQGPFYLSIAHRGFHYVVINIVIGLAVLFWRCMAMFLIGIAIIRSGMMTRLAEHRRFLRKLALILMPAGFAIEAVGEYVGWRLEPGVWASMIPEVSTYVGSFGISMGYFGVICLLSLSTRGAALLTPFAAAGRMALTNYIGQSVLCGFVFFSFGFGMIGQIRFSIVLLIAVGIFTFQLLFSAIWLRYFRFGPLEWLWRLLTYLKVEAILRSKKPATETTTNQGMIEG